MGVMSDEPVDGEPTDESHGVHSASPEEPAAPAEDVEGAEEWAEKTETGGNATK